MTGPSLCQSGLVRSIVLGALGWATVAHADHSLLDDLPASLRLAPDGQPLNADQTKTLLARKTVSQLLESPDGGTRPGVSMGLIDAPPADVFKVLRDYPHFPEFMPYMKQARVDEHVGNRYLVSYSVRPPLGIGDRDYQLEVFDEKETIDGIEVLVSRFQFTGKGNIKETRGTWQLVPVDGGKATFAKYMTRTDAGGSLPAWLKRKAAASSLERVVDAVRKRATSH